MWLDTWTDFYKGGLGIALTDTVTTDVFLRDFNGVRARVFDGVRHDSSDPFVWGNKMLTHYRCLRIDPINKRFVFSDNLNTEKYIKIHNYFKQFCRPQAGIGTHFTNDCGVKALNMVIKMVTADFGNGPKDVVKLSDEPGKHTGNPNTIFKAKQELDII
jgi:nicotinate phosphoribosyltransferase